MDLQGNNLGVLVQFLLTYTVEHRKLKWRRVGTTWQYLLDIYDGPSLVVFSALDAGSHDPQDYEICVRNIEDASSVGAILFTRFTARDLTTAQAAQLRELWIAVRDSALVPTPFTIPLPCFPGIRTNLV